MSRPGLPHRELLQFAQLLQAPGQRRISELSCSRNIPLGAEVPESW